MVEIDAQFPFVKRNTHSVVVSHEAFRSFLAMSLFIPIAPVGLGLDLTFSPAFIVAEFRDDYL